MYDKTRLFTTNVKRVLGGLGLAGSLALLTSCGSGSSSGTNTTPPPSALKITSSTTLFPTFDPAVSDYVCTSNSGSVRITANAPTGTTVAVDGHAAQALNSTTQVNITAGQSFPIVVTTGGTATTYHVRCLPADFPAWTTERPGSPQSDYYGFTPDISDTLGAARRFLVIADNHGVPIWWYRASDEPRNLTVLGNGDIAYTLPAGVEERKPDGSLVRTFTADSSNGGQLDLHELLQLPNGNFVVIANVFRGPVDLTAQGGGPATAIFDEQIEEITPGGALVWRWSSLDHIPVSEMEQIWWEAYAVNSPIADPYHMNSVEPDGDGYVISYRHLDALFRIDKATGNVTWKLGGTHRAESLAFQGDPYNNFGGQHDARILADGTLTLHDNGSERNRPPRAVRYSLNTSAKTATLLEQVVDPDVTSSNCCGGARKLPTGNWVMSWGASHSITEIKSDGTRVFRMKSNDPFFSYRVSPIAASAISRNTLRSGMDAQFPR